MVKAAHFIDPGQASYLDFGTAFEKNDVTSISAQAEFETVIVDLLLTGVSAVDTDLKVSILSDPD